MDTLRNLFLQHVGQTSENPLAIEIEKAEGIYLYSPTGKRYIDLISGISVSNIGHSNPEVVKAVQEQAAKYMHLMVYGEMIESPQVMLAKRLSENLDPSLDSVYFVNSGSEAIEGSLKLAKRYTGRTELISFKKAYHGSSHGALSIMGDEEFKNSFRPLLPDVRHIEFNNLNELSKITRRTAAVIAEPVQGEAGIIPATKEFLEALKERCREVGALLIFDEVQTGFGRTGSLFAFHKYGVVPDIVVMAKGLGGGMPLGAFAAKREIMSAFKTNPILGHITTFGGHPVSCAASLASLNFILDNKIAEQVEEKGALLEELLSANPKVKEIRRSGLMMAIEFNDAVLREKIVNKVIEKGAIVDWFLFCDTAMRIAPPLIISKEEITAACEIINSAMDD